MLDDAPLTVNRVKTGLYMIFGIHGNGPRAIRSLYIGKVYPANSLVNVADAELRLKGIASLHIVDPSIMPNKHKELRHESFERRARH